MLKSRRRFAFVVGALFVGALAGWLFYRASNPQWGGGASDNFLARRARAREWKLASSAQNARWEKLTGESAPGWYAAFAEPVQTFDIYQRQRPMRPTATRAALALLPLGNFSPAEMKQLEELREFCALFFALPTRLEKPVSLQNWQIPSRKGGIAARQQFDADAILAQLKPRLPHDVAASLAITNRDLWSGDLNFVFGLASIRDRVGVYSLARYATPNATDEMQLRRACQVLAHETGHMWGITHCVFYRCCMNGSNSLADADGAPLDFCPACERKLAWNIGYDAGKRRAQLDAFYARHFPPRWVRKLD